MIDPMKSIAANPLGKPFIRTRVYGGGFWQSAVKAGIEDSDLGKVTNAFADDLDSVQLGAIVERGKNRHARDRRFHFGRNESGFNEVLAAVNDTVARGVDF